MAARLLLLAAGWARSRIPLYTIVAAAVSDMTVPPCGRLADWLVRDQSGLLTGGSREAGVLQCSKSKMAEIGKRPRHDDESCRDGDVELAMTSMFRTGRQRRTRCDPRAGRMTADMQIQPEMGRTTSTPESRQCELPPIDLISAATFISVGVSNRDQSGRLACAQGERRRRRIRRLRVSAAPAPHPSRSDHGALHPRTESSPLPQGPGRHDGSDQAADGAETARRRASSISAAPDAR